MAPEGSHHGLPEGILHSDSSEALAQLPEEAAGVQSLEVLKGWMCPGQPGLVGSSQGVEQDEL